MAAAHMEMSWPPPFRSKYNPYSLVSAIDYTMTAPLLADGSNFPCKHYQTADMGTPQGRPTATFAAGQAANLTITGGASHGGGSCQVSVSYDRGQLFTVVQSIEGGCPASAGSTSIDFAIPYDAPQGEALLAWSWFNNLGNREMYMNCAAVTIQGSASKKRDRAKEKEESLVKRAAHIPLNSRPKLFVANVGNGCTTVDSRDVKFPQPGPDVDVQSARGAVAPVGSGCQSGIVVGSQTGDEEEASAPDSATSAKSAHSAANPMPQIPATKGAPQPAAGEIASPSLADSSSSSATAIAPGTPCTAEGRWSCLLGGKSFQRCASGRWSAVQTMAVGTVCHVGQSDRFSIEAESTPAAASRSRLRQLRRGWRASE
ncbi:hypothetical protein SCUCBS95973_007553 [Sporothrix curviconia]|uniref:Extracellular protein n=1 Tax=Sporothrix curviconia TaxID=1260050 RepID=A0ABP0CEN5_9PEZI